MKDKSRQVIYQYNIVHGVSTAALLLAAYFWPRLGAVWILLFSAVSFVCAKFAIRVIEGHAAETMEQVNQTIQALIDGKEEAYFSENEDSLLGRFQTQIMKLYEILNAHREREKRERKEIQSTVSNLVHQINTPITNISMVLRVFAGRRTERREEGAFC